MNDETGPTAGRRSRFVLPTIGSLCVRATLETMPAVLLTVNPDEPSWQGVHAADLEALRRAGMLRKILPVAELPDIDHGTDVWFLSVGTGGAGAGLMGHGVLAGTVSGIMMFGGQSQDLERNPPDADHPYSYLLMDVDALLPRGDEIAAEAELRRHHLLDGSDVGDVRGMTAQVLTAGADRALRSLWSARMRPEAGSSAPVPGALPTVAVRRSTDSRFEVDPDLRRAALAHRGSACHACGLDGEETYGPAGVELMQVHLVTPPALIDEEFVPDPLVDLVPLCPTCHVVVHSGDPEPFTVSQVRSMLRSHGFLRGAVLTEHQLEAEHAAGRILEAGD
jgi:5-methylcytosine-specific restriction protein A